MRSNWKTLFGFVCVSLLSASVGVGTFAYLTKTDKMSDSVNFNSSGFHAVNYATAAENTDFTFAAEQSVNAVVHIKSMSKPNLRNNQQEFFDPFEFFFGFGRGQMPQYQAQPRVGFGSGVIISTDGYIVTNKHVIEGADEIEIITNNDETYPAKLVGSDEATDVALLKINGDSFPAIPFGDSDALKVGQWVLAVGNPFNLKSTVTAGIVSATGRANLFGQDRYGRSPRMRAQAEKIQAYIQTDAAVNPGNSGGALVNTRGELVGINTMIYSETGSYVGYSFAIPVSIVQKVVGDIKQFGTVQRAVLGISIIDVAALKEYEPALYEKLNLHEGVYISDFAEKSPAQKAGIQKGDVITSINGVKIKNFSELRAQLSRFSPGERIEVIVQRGNGTKTYTISLSGTEQRLANN
ncbi:serine protease [Bacteroidia bacterium]|nr:serine protease [Bacteroidia bacterium]